MFFLSLRGVLVAKVFTFLNLLILIKIIILYFVDSIIVELLTVLSFYTLTVFALKYMAKRKDEITFVKPDLANIVFPSKRKLAWWWLANNALLFTVPLPFVLFGGMIMDASISEEPARVIFALFSGYYLGCIGVIGILHYAVQLKENNFE